MEREFRPASSMTGSGRQIPTSLARAKSTADKSAFPVRQAAPGKLVPLSAISMFRDFSAEEMSLVDQSAFTTTAHKGKIIYVPGMSGEAIFLLMKGSVHLYRISTTGRKFIVQTIGPQSFFGEMPLIGRQMKNTFAEAAEDCTICAMGRADVERLLLFKPVVAQRMLEEIGQRMLDAFDRLCENAFKGLPARVASQLLRLSNDGAQPIVGISHQELAEMTGVYRESVTNALGRFRDEGFIETQRGKIAILNPKKLRKVAEEETLRRPSQKRRGSQFA